jgi:hypothetical protein
MHFWADGAAFWATSVDRSEACAGPVRVPTTDYVEDPPMPCGIALMPIERNRPDQTRFNTEAILASLSIIFVSQSTNGFNICNRWSLHP